MSNYKSRNTKLVPAICTQCGGSVEVDPSQEKAFCKHCGTSFFVEKAINNYNVQHATIEHVESMNIHNNKRGSVESILNFFEKQQENSQKILDEYKRKRKEQLQNTIDQIFNKKYRKRNLIIIGAVAILIFIISIMVATREKPSHEGEARTPGGSSYHQGRDYKDVVSDFEERGFINIKTEKLEDLITGWITKDGEVESVSVDYHVDYTANKWYPNDVKVIITYHTFLWGGSDDITEDDNNEGTEEAANTLNSVTEENSQNDNENPITLDENYSDLTNTTVASIYEKGYRIKFNDYDIFYLIDEDAKTISIFDTVEEYTEVYVSEYSGDFNNGIEFDWNGLKMRAHNKYVDQDAILIIHDESGNENEATKLTVDIVEGYIKTR